MRAAIVPNSDKEKAIKYASDVIEYLSSYSTEFFIPDEFKDSFASANIHYCCDHKEAIKKSDFVIAIGGDGTIIHTAKHAAQMHKPVLGVNCGRVGFVANLEPTDLHLLSKLFNGEYVIDERMMLEVVVDSGSRVTSMYALNDVTVSRGALSRMFELNVHLNDEFINSYRSDGLILSTPTGSTAYSLSAGGPVIEPHMKCILLTPICPHSLFSRSVLFSDDSSVTIKPNGDCSGEIYVSVDGVNYVKLEPSGSVTVKKSNLTANFIKLDNKNFYRILKDKLNERRN